MLVEKAEGPGCGAVRTVHLLRMKIVYHVQRSQLSSTRGLAGLYAGDMLLMWILRFASFFLIYRLL